MRVKLKDVFELQMGKTPARNNPSYWNGTHKWVSIADIGCAKKYIDTTKEKITQNAITESGIRGVPAHTVIMSFKLSIGKTAITAEDMYTNEAIMAFINKGTYDVDTDYFYHLCCGIDWSEGTNKAVLGLTLNKATLSDKWIPLPDLPTQHRIAATLDAVTTLITKRHQQLDALDQLVKARFVEMFGKCKDHRRLEQYAVLITKGASPKWQGVDYCEKGTLFITSENVREGYLELSKRKYLDDKINMIQPRSMLKRNDILINIVGASIGRAAVYDWDEIANINQAVALVRADFSQINQTYLMTFLNSPQATEMYEKMKKGGARDNLSLQNIADLQVPVAPLELQSQFATFVTQVDHAKATVQQSLQSLETLKKSLMQQYFG